MIKKKIIDTDIKNEAFNEMDKYESGDEDTLDNMYLHNE